MPLHSCRNDGCRVTLDLPAEPVSLEHAMHLAHGHWQGGEAALAEHICHRVLTVQPRNPDALHLLGVIANAAGKQDLAIDLLHKATAAPGVPAVFFSNLAEMCRQRQRLDEAETAGRRAVAKDAASADAWNNLGIVLQERGKFEEGLGCLRRALALRPGYAQAHNNLGNTFKKLGDLAAAEAAYAQAIALRPDYAEAFGNLAASLEASGRHGEALAAAERSITLSPGSVDAHVTGSSVLRTLGRKAEALRWAQQAVAAAAGDPSKTCQALLAVANCLKVLDRYEEALAVCQSALAAKPDDGDAVNAIGTILPHLGRHELAVEALDRAAALMPNPASAYNNLGTALMEMGREAAVEPALRAAIAADSGFAPAWYNLADVKRFEAGDPDLAAIEGLLSRRPPPPYDYQTMLHFALGKAHDEAGDTDRAMAHLHQGNRMKRATFAYDSPATAEWLKRIAETFSPEMLARFDNSGDPTPAPVFIVGMPRSGTSLVEQVLASHPAIHGAGELCQLKAIVGSVKGADGPLPFPAMMRLLEPQHLTRMGAAYATRIHQLAPGAKRIVDKMPGNFVYLGLIRLLLPNARIIHCRRNPIDTCLSCYSKFFAGDQLFTYDLAELGQFYRGYHRLMEHWHTIIPSNILTDIVYEDIVDDLEGQARRLIAFCGLDWDDRCLDFHSSKRTVRTASVNQVRKPIYRSSVQRWRRYSGHLGPLLDALDLPAA